MCVAVTLMWIFLSDQMAVCDCGVGVGLSVPMEVCGCDVHVGVSGRMEECGWVLEWPDGDVWLWV